VDARRPARRARALADPGTARRAGPHALDLRRARDADEPERSLRGNQIARTSKHQFALGIGFDAPLNAEWRAFGRADASYRSKQYTSSINLQSLPQQRNLNARVGIENGRYTVSPWGRNLTDERFARSFVNFPAPDEFPVFTTLAFQNQARTYGLTLAARF
jgi:hypothetical protein